MILIPVYRLYFIELYRTYYIVQLEISNILHYKKYYVYRSHIEISEVGKNWFVSIEVIKIIMIK